MSLASLQADLLGTRLSLWLGMTVALPAPAIIVEALSGVEATLTDKGSNGFQLVFSVGRTGYPSLDYQILSTPLLKPFNRVVIQIWKGVVPETLIDGFITRSELHPSDEPGSSTLTVTGEDLRVLMDLHEITVPYPATGADVQVRAILARYAVYLGKVPNVLPPTKVDVPSPTDRIPVQADTDLKQVECLARRHGYVFYIEPTPVPMVNNAYWGPQIRPAIEQPALSVNMGPQTNATIRFNYNSLGPKIVLGMIQDKKTKAIVPVVTIAPARPPLSPILPAVAQAGQIRTVMAREFGSLDPSQAFARAQAESDHAGDAVTAEGELEMQRYGHILRARRTVDVRGAGWLFNGPYYVERVTHKIRRGEYTQNFTLKREGLGALKPVVKT